MSSTPSTRAAEPLLPEQLSMHGPTLSLHCLKHSANPHQRSLSAKGELPLLHLVIAGSASQQSSPRPSLLQGYQNPATSQYLNQRCRPRGLDPVTRCNVVESPRHRGGAGKLRRLGARLGRQDILRGFRTTLGAGRHYDEEVESLSPHSDLLLLSGGVCNRGQKTMTIARCQAMALAIRSR